MTKLAICEKKGIEKDIQISGYYKKDYASLKKWITLIGITIGYGLAAALFAVCASDTLLEDLTFIKLQKNGVIFAPGKAANAGGVATSALEMSQNSERLSWTFEEVDSKLKNIMVNICHNMSDAAEKYGFKGNYVVAEYLPM